MDWINRVGMGDNSVVLIWGMVLLVSIAAVGVASVAAAGEAADWPQFQKDENNNGYTYEEAPLGVNFAWRANLSAAIDVEPLVVGDSVIVYAMGNVIHSLNKTTGVHEWTSADLGTGSYTLSTPTYGVDNNTIYAVAQGGATGTTLYAINASAGNEIWHVSIKKPDGTTAETGQPNTPVLFYNNSTTSLDDDVVCFGTWSGENSAGTYYIYDAADGSPIYNRTSTHTRGYYWAGAAPINQRYIVYGEDSGYLTAVDLWSSSVSDEESIGVNDRIRSSVNWCPTNSTYGYLFFTSRSGAYLHKVGFDASTGTFTDESHSNDIHYSTSTPTITGGRVYVGGGNFSTGHAALLCMNESDVSQSPWAYEPNGAVQSSPAVSIQNGVPYAYFTTNCKDGQFYCVKDDVSSGDLQWSFATLETGRTRKSGAWDIWLGAQLQGVAISDDWVYGGNDGGAFYGLSNVTPAAYGYQVDASPGCSDPNVEFSPADYAKIRVDDYDLAESVTNAPDYFAAQRFNFSIETPVANVTAINVTWVGKGEQNDEDGASLYIYDFTSGGYEFLQASGDTPDKVTLTGEITSNASNYISSGNVVIQARQNSQQSGDYTSSIETDYVKVIITVT